MIAKRIRFVAGLTIAAGLVGMSGCRVHVDKGSNGEDKNVQVDTPFGGVHVNTDQTTASDVGVPLYPGAEEIRENGKHKSADVHMGFGEWQMRVRAVSYTTHDSQQQVTDFYRKALSRYGDVIVCQNNHPVGKPEVTGEGLTCNDEKNPNIKIDNGYDSHGAGLELKAGSKRHQHIVGFESSKENETRFALVALDLPSFVEHKSGKSD